VPADGNCRKAPPAAECPYCEQSRRSVNWASGALGGIGGLR